jgi:hypothetical protein
MNFCFLELVEKKPRYLETEGKLYARTQGLLCMCVHTKILMHIALGLHFYFKEGSISMWKEMHETTVQCVCVCHDIQKLYAQSTSLIPSSPHPLSCIQHVQSCKKKPSAACIKTCPQKKTEKQTYLVPQRHESLVESRQ